MEQPDRVEFKSALKSLLMTIVVGVGIFHTNQSFGAKMNHELYIYTGDDNLAHYDFKIQTPVLGVFNPTVYGLLINSNEKQELLPGLISEWKWEFKEKKYLLTLADAKFHNGREITAEDLEFSLIRGFISASENYNRIHFSDIKGITDLKVGMKYKSGMVPGLKVLNKKQLQIELSNINPIFLLNFTVPFVPLVPQEELKDDYFTWKKVPIGAGPYKVESDYHDHRLKLVAVKPTSDRPSIIVMDNARKMEKYDVIFDEVKASPQEQNFEKVLSKYPVSIASLAFYRDNPLNQDLNFRKAVYHAIDRDSLSLGADQYRPAYEMMVRPYGGRAKPQNPYDPVRAKAYLEKVPHKLLKNGVKVGVYATNDDWTPVMRERINRMTAQFEKIGLHISFSANPEKFPTPEVVKKFTIKMRSKVVDLADPAVSYGAMSSRSPYSKENPIQGNEYDVAYEKALKASDLESRFHAIQEIAHLIEEQALAVPLMQKYAFYRINPEKVKTLGSQAKPLFLDLSKVEMK